MDIFCLIAMLLLNPLIEYVMVEAFQASTLHAKQ